MRPTQPALHTEVAMTRSRAVQVAAGLTDAAGRVQAARTPNQRGRIARTPFTPSPRRDSGSGEQGAPSPAPSDQAPPVQTRLTGAASSGPSARNRSGCSRGLGADPATKPGITLENTTMNLPAPPSRAIVPRCRHASRFNSWHHCHPSNPVSILSIISEMLLCVAA